ncbi:hypothetical protein VNG_2673H [Halobacterium salinarum NRC-1]|uniref:Spurious ORF n=1 Tax=Halobacterium salinarum (strain ATCC 700922 / JCM 11081 / NRC-1) TaxID=64091 RepID=Q9HM74_HALSA|nr:hypothetical protein VNG_2673H [Halobacterium salinarum NRC-1]DAC79468.1 TPA_inf: spurious ORF [Halobacterium salinarum NRC-1]
MEPGVSENCCADWFGWAVAGAIDIEELETWTDCELS